MQGVGPRGYKKQTSSAVSQRGFYPDPRKDLESRSPNLGPCTTKGTLEEPPLRDLLFGSSRGSGYRGVASVSKLKRLVIALQRMNEDNMSCED